MRIAYRPVGLIFLKNVTDFSRLNYHQQFIDTAIKIFVASKAEDQQPIPASGDRPTVRIDLPFKDQVSADFVRKQLKDLSQKTHTAIQPVFVSNKLNRTGT